MEGAQRRSTRQREAVLSAVRSLACHPTAEEVYDRVRQTLPGTSMSTVYRNLGVLVEQGDLCAIRAEGGEVHYDHRLQPHGHLRCRVCGRVCDVLTEPVEPCELRPVGSEGFTIESVDVSFTGVCPECGKAEG